MNTAGGYEREFVAEFYDHFRDYAQRQDVAFYVGLAKESGGPVLELGCGTGRVLIPTARAGIQITGLDLSEHMLDICRQKLGQEAPDVQARVQLAHADIRGFDMGRRFRLSTIPFRPFQHLVTVEEQLACLSCVHRHLEPGGRLALDVFNPRLSRLVAEQEEHDEGPPFLMPDGRSVVRKSQNASIDLKNQIINVELTYYITHADGRQERFVHAFLFRYFFRYEMEHLLARAGFEVEALYSDFDRSPNRLTDSTS